MIESDKQYELVDGIWKEVKQPLTGWWHDGWDGCQESSFSKPASIIKKCPHCGSKDLIPTVINGRWYCRGCLTDINTK